MDDERDNVEEPKDNTATNEEVIEDTDADTKDDFVPLDELDFTL